MYTVLYEGKVCCKEYGYGCGMAACSPHTGTQAARGRSPEGLHAVLLKARKLFELGVRFTRELERGAIVKTERIAGGEYGVDVFREDTCFRAAVCDEEAVPEVREDIDVEHAVATRV